MQKIKNLGLKCFEKFFTDRTTILVLTFFMLAVCGNIHTRWAKSLFYFFIMPVQIGMSYTAIRNKTIRMDGVFRLVCVSLLWLLMSLMLNSFWSNPGMVGCWTMFGCWIFALFIPKDTSMKTIHDQLFKVGMVFIIGFLPFILIALYSVFTGKVIYVLGEHTPVGVQTAGDYGSRIRIMMNPNKIGIILAYNIFFSIYGLVTRKKKLWRAFFVFILIVNTLAMAHVMSRTCIMGLAAAMGLFGFRFIYQKLGKKKLLAIAAGLLVCVLVFFLVVYGMEWIYNADVAIAKWINHDTAAELTSVSRNEEFGTFDATSSGRGKIWKGVIELLKKEPLGLVIGYGAEDVMQKVADASGVYYLSDLVHVHSAYLDAITTGGVPYLLMVFAFLFMLIKPAWQLGMESRDAETRGLFVVPMFIVALLVMSISEVMLFVDNGHVSYLFMMMCGYLLHYKALLKERKQA